MTEIKLKTITVTFEIQEDAYQYLKDNLFHAPAYATDAQLMQSAIYKLATHIRDERAKGLSVEPNTIEKRVKELEMTCQIILDTQVVMHNSIACLSKRISLMSSNP